MGHKGSAVPTGHNQCGIEERNGEEVLSRNVAQGTVRERWRILGLVKHLEQIAAILLSEDGGGAQRLLGSIPVSI